MRNVSDKGRRENRNTHFMFNKLFPEIVPFMRSCEKILQRRTSLIWQYGACAFHAVYLRRLHTNTHTHTHTHTEYVTFIAFPLQKWLHERPSIFRYTYSACLCSKLRSSQLVLRSLYLIRGKVFSVVIYALLWTQQYRRMKKEQRAQVTRMKDTGNGCVKFCWKT